MEYYLGNTDWTWFNYLSEKNPEDINFWQPGGRNSFRALKFGGAFLFKLKKPYNAIGGIGFFAAQSQIPLSSAWDTFNWRNGFSTMEDFRNAIQHYNKNSERNPTIGCVALTNPVFFKRVDWIPIHWKPGIVQGKIYSTLDTTGLQLWHQIETVLNGYSLSITDTRNSFTVDKEIPQYGIKYYAKYALVKVLFGSP